MIKILKKIFHRLFPMYHVRKYIKETKLEEEIWGGGLLKNHIGASLKQFLSNDDICNSKYVKTLTEDIVKAYLIQGASPLEYFLYNFERKNNNERSSYVTDKDKDIVCMQVVGLDAYKNDLANKYNFYRLMSPFFKRDVCLVSTSKDWEAYDAFVSKHPKFFKKINKNSSYGYGCTIEEINNNKEILFNAMLDSKTEWLLEELIVQDDSMALWNKSSVNTIRISSFLVGNNFKNIVPFLRTGRAGSVVDNGGSGGIIAGINKEDGVIFSHGYDEFGNVYVEHPDSKYPYKGKCIPKWNELLALCKKAHEAMPTKHKYVAWDFAFTPQGWVLIEGNWGQFVGQQLTAQIGLKDEFHDYMFN